MGGPTHELRIERIGAKRHPFRELYYVVLKTTWPKFVSMVALVYLAINCGFALLYWLLPGAIAQAEPGSFSDSFFFSIETFATIGYGHLLPQTFAAHVVVTIESFAAILYSAIITGLTFAKFSRPVVHTIFSNRALVVQYDGVPTLMFRMGNGRDTNIVDAQLRVMTLKAMTSPEGISMQRFVDLKLERDYSSFFIMSWTVLHKIDHTSPFYGYTADDFKKHKTQIFVSLIGYDETYSQTVHSSYRYNAEDIVFAKRIMDVVDTREDGVRRIDFTRFHDIVDL